MTFPGNAQAATKPKKLTVSEATKNIRYESVKTDQGLVIIFKNNNSQNVSLKVTTAFYDTDNNRLSSESKNIFSFQSKTESVLTFTYPIDSDYNIVEYDNFKIKFKVSLNSDLIFLSHFKDIAIDDNQGASNIIADITNRSKKTCEIMLTALYYDSNKKLVGFNEQEIPFLSAGDTETINFDNPYDADYDEIEYDSYKIVLNQAFTY
jgi:hypothetical protein